MQGLKAAQARLQAFGSAVRGIGLGISAAASGAVTAPAAATAVFTQRGGDIADAAKRTGMTTEAMSELGYAATLSGSSMEELEGGVRIMQRMIAAAGEGSQASADALGRLGLSAQQLAGMSPDQQLEAIADGLSGITSPAERTAAVMGVFGRSGAKLIPLLEGGSTAMRRMRGEAVALGASLSGADARSAEELGNAMKRVRKAATAVAMAIGAALAPTIADVANRVATVIGGVSRWIDQNRGLIVTVAATAAALLAAGTALVGIGLAATVAGAAVGGIATAIGAIGTVAGVAAGAVGLLITPLGLVVAAAAAAGVSIAMMSSTGGASLASLRQTATDTLGGIAEALRAGDIRLAAIELWSGLKAAWANGMAEISTLWETWTTDLAQALFVVQSTALSVVSKAQELLAGQFLADSAGTQVQRSNLPAWLSDPLGLQLSEGDVGRAKALMAQDTTAKETERAARLSERIAALEQSRSAALRRIEQERRDALKGIREEIEQERRNSEGARVGPPVPSVGRSGTGPLEIEALAGEVARQAAAVRGTFNAGAVQALQGGVSGSAQDRTARATEKSAELLRRMLDRASTDGLVFAE
jgi:hypothetical protein